MQSWAWKPGHLASVIENLDLQRSQSRRRLYAWVSHGRIHRRRVQITLQILRISGLPAVAIPTKQEVAIEASSVNPPVSRFF